MISIQDFGIGLGIAFILFVAIYFYVKSVELENELSNYQKEGKNKWKKN